MQVFIVHAHHEPQSFCSALRDVGVEVLSAAGHEVRQSDLYQMGFKAVADGTDFVQRANPSYLKYQAEQRGASETNGFAGDIVAEQKKLLWADHVIFIFPLWWFGLPAILKGWFDRVLSVGFAYGGGRWFDTGPLKGRRALLTITTGGLSDRFREDGLFGDFNTILHPVRVGTLNFVGIETLAPFVAWGAASVSPAQRGAYLEDYRHRLVGLAGEPAEKFRSLADFPDPRSRDH